ncbi:hypothetical protein LOC71_08245 [Rhodopirellula sp. JC740]|uniref:Uncharacterized protein n=1 Tax=Rhodopirellula halodulae TaxID=2894198 RepID=A0ABS8NH41_9BACT|nr:hypothetical protein [Rhodopirellula sp. JC740]
MTLSVNATDTHNVNMEFQEKPDPNGGWTRKYAFDVARDDALKALEAFIEKDDLFRTSVGWEQPE